MAYSLTYSYDSTNQSYSVTGYSNITTSDKVVIPDKYDDGTNGEHAVTSIADAAFFNCSSLTSVSIGNSVTSIGSYAFQNCSNLTSVAIPNSVTSIGSYAFYNCSSLTSVMIPDSVTSIDERAFSGCSGLTSVTIGNSVTSIGSSAFSGCSSLTSITIPNSVTSIGDGAFDACSSLVQLILFQSTPPNLGSYAIPNNVQSIYVQQSSKAAYQAATNWTAFASKIVSDNIYLSFVRFNQKNKEYIDKKLTSSLSNFSGKIYRHTLNISGSSMTYILMFFSPDSTAITTTTLINDNGSWITGATGRNLTTSSGCICLGYAPLEALIISDNGNLVQFNYSSMTNITDSVVEL